MTSKQRVLKRHPKAACWMLNPRCWLVEIAPRRILATGLTPREAWDNAYCTMLQRKQEGKQ